MGLHFSTILLVVFCPNVDPATCQAAIFSHSPPSSHTVRPPSRVLQAEMIPGIFSSASSSDVGWQLAVKYVMFHTPPNQELHSCQQQSLSRYNFQVVNL